MEKSLLLDLLGDKPLFRMIDFLLENKGMDFSKLEIARGAGIARASLFNHWNETERYGIVRETRRFGKTKLYTLNVNNAVTRRLIELEKALITKAMDESRGIVKHRAT